MRPGDIEQHLTTLFLVDGVNRAVVRRGLQTRLRPEFWDSRSILVLK